MQWSLELYRCIGNQTASVEVFCESVGTASDTPIFNPTPGTTYTRQVVDTNARTGYYAAVGRFVICAIGSQGSFQTATIQSNTKQLTYSGGGGGGGGRDLPDIKIGD